MATNNALNEKNTGLQALKSDGSISGVTLTGTSNQISIATGDGISGNPTASLTSTIQVSGLSLDAGTTTLSSYSTGTFSPTIINATTPGTYVYATQLGRYTRIGFRAFININIVMSTYTAGTGNVQLQSLPFTSDTTVGNSHQYHMDIQNTTFGASVLWYAAVWGAGATFMQISGMRSATGALNLAAAGPSNTSIFRVTMINEVL